MSLRFPAPLAALAIALVTGCTTTTQTAPDTPPAAEKPTAIAPATGTAQPATPPAEVRPATIRGSEESSTLLDNFTAFIRAVDGVPISAARKGWNQAVELKPGAHRITVEFIRGSFFARTDLSLNAKPGAAYELRQSNDAQVYGQHSYCDFWIVDLATNEKAALTKRAAIERVKQ